MLELFFGVNTVINGNMGAGVSACDDIEEAGDAIEDEEHRMVDEEETLACRVQAAREELRTPTMGCHAWR